mmetsp:Transcript_3111/g.12077  ORF Transcript_3111/g.12077 Transcript_3111/m.12077 type:complete len:235 (-) Transcript_3111:31-735(-)
MLTYRKNRNRPISPLDILLAHIKNHVRHAEAQRQNDERLNQRVQEAVGGRLALSHGERMSGLCRNLVNACVLVGHSVQVAMGQLTICDLEPAQSQVVLKGCSPCSRHKHAMCLYRLRTALLRLIHELSSHQRIKLPQVWSSPLPRSKVILDLRHHPVLREAAPQCFMEATDCIRILAHVFVENHVVTRKRAPAFVTVRIAAAELHGVRRCRSDTIRQIVHERIPACCHFDTPHG